MPFQQLKELW